MFLRSAAILQLGNCALSLALHRLIVIPSVAPSEAGIAAGMFPHADCRLKGVDQNGNRFPFPPFLRPPAHSYRASHKHKQSVRQWPHDDPSFRRFGLVGVAEMILQNCIGIVFNSPFALHPLRSSLPCVRRRSPSLQSINGQSNVLPNSPTNAPSLLDFLYDGQGPGGVGYVSCL